MADQIKHEVKQGGYASTSEFIRALMREYNRAKLAEELHANREQFRKGEGKLLTSLRDLR